MDFCIVLYNELMHVNSDQLKKFILDTSLVPVKEVEEALVRLNSADKILPEAQLAVEGYSTHFQAVQTLYQNGLGNLLNVEVARRQRLAAELAVKELEREQVSAWIALYRAAGGNWSKDQNNDTNNGKKS